MFDDMFEDDEYLDDADNASAAPSSGLKPPQENPDLFSHTQHEKMLLSLFNDKKLPHALIFG